MRIRSIKPEFWRSNDISALSVEDRLLFIGLWSYVDDNGVGVDKLSSITADLFADDLERDPSETFARVSRGLQHLSAAGRIVRYTLEKYDYLEITNWTKHQRIDRPNKPRLPHHNAEGAVIREGVASVSRDPSDWNRGTGEQGNRGTDTLSSHVASDDDGQSNDPEPEFSEDVTNLCQHLADWIVTNGNRKPTIGKNWKQAIDRLIRIDGYTPDQIRQVIDWSQQDEFWQGNILSASKLRKQFDQLKNRMFQDQRRPTQTQQHLTASQRRLQEGYEREQRILNGELSFDNSDNPYLQPRPTRAIEGGQA